jgi:hypothetical protein
MEIVNTEYGGRVHVAVRVATETGGTLALRDGQGEIVPTLVEAWWGIPGDSDEGPDRVEVSGPRLRKNGSEGAWRTRYFYSYQAQYPDWLKAALLATFPHAHLLVTS